MAELSGEAVGAEVERTKEYLKELIHSAFWGKDAETVRKGWTEFLQLSMPEELKKEPYLLEDIVETNVMLRDAWHGFFIDYGDKEYEAETVFEAQFLSYLTLALKRGTPFEVAWERATRLLGDENRVSRVVYELTTDDDQYEVGLWTERLTGMGVESSEASTLAQEVHSISFPKFVFLVKLNLTGGVNDRSQEESKPWPWTPTRQEVSRRHSRKAYRGSTSSPGIPWKAKPEFAVGDRTPSLRVEAGFAPSAIGTKKPGWANPGFTRS